MPLSIDPWIVAAWALLLLVSGGCSVALHFKRQKMPDGSPFDVVDRVLWVCGAPLFIFLTLLGAVVVMGRLRGAASNQREGDTDLATDGPSSLPEESRSEQVVRILETQAEKAEAHILEEATEDEVGARGAALFGLETRPGEHPAPDDAS